MTGSKRKSWLVIPPWIVIGAVVILAPIFLFVALENINKQKENTTRLLVEKGAALIRSFEAGTRTGMMGMRWGGLQVQRLLTETSQQPDIIYLLITDNAGKVVAHNDLSKIGKYHGMDLDLESISKSKTLKWRQIKDQEGGNIFEVFRMFSPVKSPSRRRFPTMMHDDWFRSRYGQMQDEPDSPLIIFVGLDMAPVETARKEDARHTLFMTAILLLIGFAGIISLFLAQGYQSAKTSLSRIKAFSDNLVANMPIGLLAFDRNTRVTSINQTAGALLQLPVAKSIGKKAEEIIPDQLAVLLDRMKKEKGIIEKEIEWPMTDGRIIPLEVIATHLKEEDDTFLGYIILFRDLTEIQHLRKEIDRSKRLASIGRLAAGVAHEIRNPLSSIKGFATYFRERYSEIPEDQKTADIMVQEVDRLNRVIGQLLEFARPMNIQLKSVSLEAFIKRSIKMVEGQAINKGIKILTNLSSGLDDAFIDPDRINQVFLNLYLNAIEAMEDGETLSVTLAPYGEKRVKIEISDTGRGIAKKDVEKIFDPYFTTKPSGTGLGLAIVHRIIEAHKGKIRVQSGLGRGTTVTVILPLLSNETDSIQNFNNEDQES